MQLEKHELVQIGIPCKVVPTKSVTVLKDYSYMGWRWWCVWITPGDVRVDFGKVLSWPGVCVGKGGSDCNVLWPGVKVRGLLSVGLSRTHSPSLPDSSDWE